MLLFISVKCDHLVRVMSRVSWIVWAACVLGPVCSVSAETPAASRVIPSEEGELKKALDGVPVAERPAMEFLISHMPEADRKSLDARFLLENHREAFAARNAHEWARKVPEPVFFNDVLPYASLNEKRELWRTDFRRRFSPVVAPASSLKEAARLLNQAIRGELKVEYNTKRRKPDQSPSESIEQGMASCSGLSILLCDALRSVGIPARIAGTAAWTTKPGNHNWVEFYDPESATWHFTEYYPDEKGFDHGWLIADAAKAVAGHPLHGVYASSWKPTGKVFPLVWDLENRSVPGEDVTDRYIGYGKKVEALPENHCELRVDWIDSKGVRTAVKAEVCSGGKVLATGVTPGPTADLNEFLSIAVPQGELYKVRFPDGTPEVEVEVKSGVKSIRVAGRQAVVQPASRN